MNPVWKLNFFLFNIEVYGEFFSGITPYKEAMAVPSQQEFEKSCKQVIVFWVYVWW